MKKRIISAMLAGTLLLTACSGAEPSQSEDNTTASETVQTSITETEQTTEATTSEESETEPQVTADSSGMYTYKIYEGTDNETEIKMDINIDDYIFVSDKTGNTVFDYSAFTTALKFDAEKYFLTYNLGDHIALLVMHSQSGFMSEISFSYCKNIQGAPAFSDTKKNPGHGGYIIAFDIPQDESIYYLHLDDTDPYSAKLSRNQALVCAYVAWVIANSPDNSTPVGDAFRKFVDKGRGVIVCP